MGPLNCTNTSITGDGGSGSGSGEWWQSIPPYGGYIPAEVVNLINDLCLKQMVEAAKSANTSIRAMLNDLTDHSYSKVKVVFKEMDAPSTAWATAQRGGPDGTVDTISLNTTLLKGMAKEFIVATVYHEVLHTYLSAHNIQGNQHQAMADAFIRHLVGGLQAAFPGLSQHDAWALTWDGMKDTSLWTQTNPVLLTEPQKTDIDHTMNRFRKTAALPTRLGTYCQ